MSSFTAQLYTFMRRLDGLHSSETLKPVLSVTVTERIPSGLFLRATQNQDGEEEAVVISV